LKRLKKLLPIFVVDAYVVFIVLTIKTKNLFLTYSMFILMILFNLFDIYDVLKSNRYKTKILIGANNLAAITAAFLTLDILTEIPQRVNVTPENLGFYLDLRAKSFKIEIAFFIILTLNHILRMKRFEKPKNLELEGHL
jgi:hypothetical protein